MMKALLLVGLTPQVLSVPGRDAFRISVDVDLVVLHATIRDGAGRPAANLREGNIEVYEDGVRQLIRFFGQDDSPLTVGLVVDHSGSIRSKLEDIVAGAKVFARNSHPLDEMFVVNFNENVAMPQPDAAPFTSDPDELERAITGAPAAGKTALYDAILSAAKRLRMGRHEKRALIVISDGGDNASTHSLADVLRTAAMSSTLIYTIGVFAQDDPDRNPRALGQLAKASGGEAFFPSRSAEVVEICQRIARNMRQHYTIGYVSSNAARDGAYRSVRLVAKQDGRKLSTRVRAGYIAGGGR